MKKRKAILLLVTLIITVIVILISCSNNTAQTQKQKSYGNIDADELKAMMDNKDFTLINVHIPYAGEIEGTDLFIPYNDIESLDLPKNEKIVIYCRSGSMSGSIMEKFKEMGYEEVYNLKKGMNEWTEKGYDLKMDENKLP